MWGSGPYPAPSTALEALGPPGDHCSGAAVRSPAAGLWEPQSSCGPRREGTRKAVVSPRCFVLLPTVPEGVSPPVFHQRSQRVLFWSLCDISVAFLGKQWCPTSLSEVCFPSRVMECEHLAFSWPLLRLSSGLCQRLPVPDPCSPSSALGTWRPCWVCRFHSL